MRGLVRGAGWTAAAGVLIGLLSAGSAAAEAQDPLHIVGPETSLELSIALADRLAERIPGLPRPTIEATDISDGFARFCSDPSVSVTSATRRITAEELRSCQDYGVSRIREIQVGWAEDKNDRGGIVPVIYYIDQGAERQNRSVRFFTSVLGTDLSAADYQRVGVVKAERQTQTAGLRASHLDKPLPGAPAGVETVLAGVSTSAQPAPRPTPTPPAAPATAAAPPPPVDTGVIAPTVAEDPFNQRLALIIGNAGYGASLGPLRNPVNDARLMARTLTDLGFDVTVEPDLDFRAMRRAVRAFGDRIRAAGPDSVALFFYSGHGVQYRGENYFAPIDAVIEKEADIPAEAISANAVLAQMEEAGARVNLLLLDACRNSPYARSTRSAAKGLAPMRAESGTLIAYATRPGAVALDGDGENSPFTLALAQEIQREGAPVELALKAVSRRVHQSTSGGQTPWIEGAIFDPFSFAPATE